MSIRTLESAILAEAKKVTDNKKLRLKDIMEWRTTKIKTHPNEKLYYLPDIGVHIAVKEQSRKKK